MQITFLGATQTVTGSKYLITVDSKKFLVDCGLFQGYKELRLRNWDKLPIDPREIYAVLLTHAHIDHTGYLPLLVKNGFKGTIYSTHATKDLCAILLPDSGFLQEEDAYHANKYNYSKHHPALPLYTREDGIKTLEQFCALNFNKIYKLFDNLSFQFLPAGHILGASLIRLEHQGKTITFTGDLGRPHDAVMRAPTVVHETDYLVIESTYGDRIHDPKHPEDQLAELIQQTVKRGGSIIIPSFAVGRAQLILYYLYILRQHDRIPPIPIFLDSPMAEDASDLLGKYAGEHRLTKQQCIEVCQIAKYIKTVDESKAIDQMHTPVIIISASGMATGGRVLHHLENFLPDHRNTIIFTGYQAGGTRGDRLLRGETEIKMHGETIPVRAQIEVISSMSAHADSEEMLAWLKNFKRPPKKVFITHGDDAAGKALKNKIESELNWTCVIPEYQQTEKL